ncbi:hypothetical protein QOZ80_4BG0329760 [Eleusine coracana subsp. coracana]|nr:hypothetical protein QOZ80_4BG0329760 [Eleusine coracana subsp. coracana]
MGTSRSPIVISDDDEPVVPPVAPSRISDATREQRRLAEGRRYRDETTQRPEWLSDEFVVGIERRCSDGTVLLKYTCPAGFTFNGRAEVEEYCASGALQRAIDSKAMLNDNTTLQGKYQWFMAYQDFVLEIRAGGENMSKLFKFYAHLGRRLHIASREDFLRYVCDGKIPEQTNEECDTCSEDNIIAQLEFLIDGLPPGWIKETAFRKCSNGIRKDSFYTDPVNKRVYRSLKAAIQSFRTGIDAGSQYPNLSVTDMYFFDNCTDMIPFLANRLKDEGMEDPQCKEAGQNSHSKKRGASDSFDQPQGKGNKPKTEKKRDKNAMTTNVSKPSRPRRRPRKS